jgi:hypothetical protein
VKTNRIGTGIYARSRPSVVLDEVSTILDTHNTTALDGGSSRGFAQQDMEVLELGRTAPQHSNGDKTTATQSSGTPDTNSKGSSPLSSVPSIVNWSKSRRELCDAENAVTDGGGDEYGVIKQSLLKRIYDLRTKGKGATLSILRDSVAGGGSVWDPQLRQGDVVEDEYFVIL